MSQERGNSPATPVASESSENPERQVWHAARGHLDVGQAILADPGLPPGAAVVHLSRAWWSLAGTGDDPAPGAGEEVRSAAAEALAKLDTFESGERAADRDALLELSRGLEAVLAVEESRRFGDELRQQLWARIRKRVALTIVALAPLWAYLIFVPFTYREGPWRGEVFPSIDFTGESYVRRDSGVDFKWKETSPSTRIPDDGWSITWDTCLILEKSGPVAFQLTSDDGSRLFVDGEKVIDNWGEHGPKTRGSEVELEAGIRHIHIDFFEAKDKAEIELNVSLDGDVPVHIPTKYLIYPGDELDAADPCGTARAEYEARK